MESDRAISLDGKEYMKTKKGTILYLSLDGMTDPLGQSQVIPYLSGLIADGYKIILLSCEKKERMERLGKEIAELLERSGISWLHVPYSNKIPLISSRLTLAKLKKKATAICHSEKIDLVHARSYMAGMVGASLRKKFATKFLFDMRGFWADERIDGGIWKLWNPIHRYLYNYFKKKELELLNTADSVVSLTETAKQEMISWNKVRDLAAKTTVIPCCADFSLFSSNHISEESRNKKKAELFINKSQLVISYLGSIGTWYMLEEMLRFYKQLLLTFPDSIFLFITQDDPSHVTSMCRELQVPDSGIRVIPAKRKEVPLLISISDISLYFIRPAYSKKASSPTKMAEILGMGVPIITNNGIGDCDLQFRNHPLGMLVMEHSDSEYQRIIKEIPLILAAKREPLVNFAADHYALSKGIEKYRQIYRTLISTE